MIVILLCLEFCGLGICIKYSGYSWFLVRVEWLEVGRVGVG